MLYLTSIRDPLSADFEHCSIIDDIACYPGSKRAPSLLRSGILLETSLHDALFSLTRRDVAALDHDR